MDDETKFVVFTVDDKSFKCPKCGKVLNENIRNMGIVTTREFGRDPVSQKATLVPAYCPSCYSRISFSEVLDNIAEYIPEVKWEPVKEYDIAEKIFLATRNPVWRRAMPTND